MFASRGFVLQYLCLTYRFGVYEFRPDTGELRKGTTPIRLQDQTARILAVLLARPGEIVTRDELRELLWSGGVHVDFETGLNSAVRRLRQTLLDNGKTPRYIETIPKKGYRWIALVERVEIVPVVAPVAPALVVPPPVAAPVARHQNPTFGRREMFALTGGSVAGLAVFGALDNWRWPFRSERETARTPRRTSLLLPPDRTLHSPFGRSVAIHPAGEEVAYVARSNGDAVPRIYRHNLRSGVAEPVEGSGHGVAPEYSPDAARFLWASPTAILAPIGGSDKPHRIHEWRTDSGPRSCSYSPEGHLVFTQPNDLPEGFEAGLASSCWVWKAGERTPEKVAIPYGGKGLETLIAQTLLQERYLLYSSNLGPEHRSINLFDLQTARRRELVSPGMGGFAHVDAGGRWRLIYYWRGNLLSAELDVEAMTLRSEPVVVLSGVANAAWGGPNAYLGADGTLVYVPEEPPPDWRLVWMSMDGKQSPVPVPPGPFSVADLSPDGRHLLLVRRATPETGTLFHYDLQTGSARELVRNAGWRACWGPRAETVAFTVNEPGAWLPSLHVMDVKTLRTTWKMASKNLAHFPFQWDERTGEIYYAEGFHARSRVDIWKVPVGAEGRKTPIATSLLTETHPRLSPDGQMIAFSFDADVRVRSLTKGLMAETTIPAASAPMWSEDSRTIYVRQAQAVYAAAVEPGVPPRVGSLRELFQGKFVPSTQWHPNVLFDRTHRRFLMVVQDTETPPRRRIEVITNWVGASGS